MRSLKTKAMSVFAALVALLVAATLFAPAAEAVTYGSPQKWGNGSSKYCPVMMYANYNAYEEWILRKHDGWELQYYALC